LSYIGSIALLLSGSIVIFAIFTSYLGLTMRIEKNLFRSLILELYDAASGRRGKKSLGHEFSRFWISFLRPLKFRFLRITGIRTQASALGLSAQAFYVNAAIITTAFVSLMTMMLLTDLKNRYVVLNSSADLPIFFRATGAWAGSSGSMLFWYFLLTIFSAIAVRQSRRSLSNRAPVLFLVLGVLQFLFILLGLFFKDAQPFREFAVTMTTGRGLNPLLLHWAMIIHPPILYTGYVSFAVPFAIVIASIISGNVREDWTILVRRWSIFAWFFLGTGILLGSKWAYEELGWGGYWAWDPVENASLMPFLLATAFLHSLIVQERRGMLRFWNVILVTLAYHFCLLGTWITRSGILQGPHTFAESTIGTPFIIYIGASFLFFMRYLYFRRSALRPKNELTAVTSKEGSMLLNNFLMLLAVFIVLVGVFSPLLPLDCSFGPGGFECHKAEWKVSTFSKIMVPVGIITLFLMGASPLLAWRKNAGEVYAKTLRIPIISGIIVGAVFGATYGFIFTRASGPDTSSWGPGIVADIFSILTVGLAAFTITGLWQEFSRGIHSRRERFGEGVFRAFVRIVLRNKRRYGGYLVHIAVVFLFLGYAGGTFKKSEKFDFHYYLMDSFPGSTEVHYYSPDKAYLEDYTVEANDLFIRAYFHNNADHTNPVHFAVSQEAHYNVTRGLKAGRPPERPDTMSPFAFANLPPKPYERLLKTFTGFVLDGRMRTERHFYPQISPVDGRVVRDENSEAIRTPTSKPDIRSTWGEDLYIQLGAILDPASGSNPDINHRYEFYYFQTEHDEASYHQIFPAAIVATVEVWVNPLVKFIWLGSLLFFFSGLILVLPFGEREAGK